MRLRFRSGWLVLISLAAMQSPAHASVHLWHVKEVFTNADGSVQFIELFNSFNNEQFMGGQTLRANSDGVIKNFITPAGNLPSSSTAGKHVLFATPGFGTLTGGVTPTYTRPNPTTSGVFFKVNANFNCNTSTGHLSGVFDSR